MEKYGIDPRPGNIDEQGETMKKTWKPFFIENTTSFSMTFSGRINTKHLSLINAKPGLLV